MKGERRSDRGEPIILHLRDLRDLPRQWVVDGADELQLRALFSWMGGFRADPAAEAVLSAREADGDAIGAWTIDGLKWLTELLPATLPADLIQALQDAAARQRSSARQNGSSTA